MSHLARGPKRSLGIDSKASASAADPRCVGPRVAAEAAGSG